MKKKSPPTLSPIQCSLCHEMKKVTYLWPLPSGGVFLTCWDCREEDGVVVARGTNVSPVLCTVCVDPGYGTDNHECDETHYCGRPARFLDWAEFRHSRGCCLTLACEAHANTDRDHPSCPSLWEPVPAEWLAVAPATR